MARVLSWHPYQEIQFFWLFHREAFLLRTFCSIFFWISKCILRTLCQLLGIPRYMRCFLVSNSLNVSRENIPKSTDRVWEVLGMWCFISPDGFGDGTARGVASRQTARGVWSGFHAGWKVQGGTHGSHLINSNVSLSPSHFPKQFPSCRAKYYSILWLTILRNSHTLCIKYNLLRQSPLFY